MAVFVIVVGGNQESVVELTEKKRGKERGRKERERGE